MTINSKPITVQPDFEYKLDDVRKHLKENKIKYNQNPANWGPESRAVSGTVKKSIKKAIEKELEEAEGE